MMPYCVAYGWANNTHNAPRDVSSYSSAKETYSIEAGNFCIILESKIIATLNSC